MAWSHRILCVLSTLLMDVSTSNAGFKVSVRMSLGTVRLRQTRDVSGDLRFDLHWRCSTQGVTRME